MIPISLTVIARWYWHVIVELTRGGDGHAPLHHHHQAPTEHGGPAATTTPASDLESGGNAAAASVSNTPRLQVVAPLNRRLALRLLMILGTTVTVGALC